MRKLRVQCKTCDSVFGVAREKKEASTTCPNCGHQVRLKAKSRRAASTKSDDTPWTEISPKLPPRRRRTKRRKRPQEKAPGENPEIETPKSAAPEVSQPLLIRMLESVSLDVVVCIVAPALLIIIIAATVPGLGFRPCYTIERNFEIDTPSGIRVFGILLTLHGVAEKSPTVFVATRINAAPGDSRVVDFEMTGMKLSTKRTITFHGKSTPYQTEINAFKVDCDVILPDEESSIIPLQLELTEQGSINVKWNNENLPRSLTGR